MNNEDKALITWRLTVVTILVLAFLGSLGWLRYDLGRETFYTVMLVLGTIVLVLVLVLLSSIGFRAAQRSDNVEVAMAGAMKQMIVLMAEQRKSDVKELRALLAQAQTGQAALPMWDDEDDEGDEEDGAFVVMEEDSIVWD